MKVFKVVQERNGYLYSAVIGDEMSSRQWERDWRIIYRDADGHCPLIEDCFAFDELKDAERFANSIYINDGKDYIYECEAEKTEATHTVAMIDTKSFAKYHNNSILTADDVQEAPKGTLRCTNLRLIRNAL